MKKKNTSEKLIMININTSSKKSINITIYGLKNIPQDIK